LLLAGLAVGPLCAQHGDRSRGEAVKPPPAPVEVAALSGRWVATELGKGTRLVAHTLTIWADGCFLSEAGSGSGSAQRASGQIYAREDRMTFVKATASSETDTFALEDGVLTITENETSWGKYRRAGDAPLPMGSAQPVDEAPLAGQWTSTEIGGSKVEQALRSVTVTFGADGTFVERALLKGGSVWHRSGHYRTNGDELVLIEATDAGERRLTYALDDGQLTIREDAKTWMRLRRVPPAELVGRWISRARGVGAHRALTLRADGSYSLDVTIEKESGESSSGDYTALPGTLLLRKDHRTTEKLAYELADGILTLQDTTGAGFRLEREPAAPSAPSNKEPPAR